MRVGSQDADQPRWRWYNRVSCSKAPEKTTQYRILSFGIQESCADGSIWYLPLTPGFMSVSPPDNCQPLLKIFPYYFYFIHNCNSTCQFKSTGGDYLDCNVCKRLWDSVDKESLVSVMSAWASDRWTGHMYPDHFPACSDHTASSLTGILAPKILPFKTFLPWGKGHARLQLRLQVSEWNTRSNPMWKSSGKSHAGTKGLHHCTEKNSFPKQGRNRHNEFSPTTFSGFHY